LKLAPVLGGLISEEKQIGLVRFPQDADGYVRAFQSSYAVGGTFAYYKERPQCQNTKDGVLPLTEAEGKIVPKAEMPAFFQVIAQAHHEAHAKRELKTASTELKYLRFREARYSFMIVDASQLLDKNNKGEFLEKTLDAAAIDRLDHPMVLIGGSYPEARDEYYTPLGPMLGVELLANAVEAQLGESTSVVGPARTAIMDVIAGLFIILIYYFFGTRPMLAVGLSLSAMVGVVAFGSFIFYSQIAAFLNFVPVMLGMWIHQMIEGTREAVHLRHELNAKETRIVELEQEQALLKAQHPVIAPLAAVPASATANEMAHSPNPQHPDEAAKAQHAQAGKTKPHLRGHAAGKSGS
jgi:CHASE2 domain-containing sensor protein